MSVLGKVEISPKIVPGATGDEDVDDCNERHDEHARARSAEDHPARRRSDAEGSVKLPKDSGSVAARSNGW